MCKQFTLLATFILLISSSYAKIWRVNNNSGINADFTTIQAAHDGASSGDTLYMEGSPNSYGSLTSTKMLTIIGPGYFLSLNPNTQALSYIAQVSTITYNVGSEGSTVAGLDISSSVNVYCSNIVIRRNLFANANGATLDYTTASVNLYYNNNNSNIPASNILIQQNFGLTIYVSSPSTGILIQNNYLGMGVNYGEATMQAFLNIADNAQVIVTNNIFRRGAITAGTTINSGGNMIFSNNIFYNGSIDASSSGFQSSNNVCSGTQFGTANGNLANIDMANVFESTTAGDKFWTLKTGSPAIGAGTNGTDAGMFGGNSPYVLSGLPAIPSVYSFTNQPLGSNTNPINVTIKVKSNN